MSVMKRKLFNREARDELRRMGGIMASSEPLMMAAQGYAPGGVVEPQQVFTPRSGLGSNIEYTYADFLQENGLNDSPQAREMFVKYQQYMESQVARGQLTNPQITQPLLDRPPVENLNEPPVATPAPSTLAAITAPSMPIQPYTASGTARGSGIEALRKADAELSVPSVMTESVPVTPSEELISSKLDPVAQAREDEINRLLAVFDDPDRTEAQVKAARQRLKQIGARDRLISAGIDLGEAVKSRIASDAADIYGVAGSGANLLGLTDAATTLFEMQKEAEAKISPAKPEKAEAAGEVEEVVEEAEAADEVEEEAAPKFPPLDQFIKLQGDRDKREKIQEDADSTVSNMTTELDDAETEEEKSGIFDKYVNEFMRILGDDKEKAAKDQGFAMAIFGATLASTGDFGQATANMVETLRGDTATRQERDDKIKMLALQATLDERKEDRAQTALLDKENRALTNAIKLAAAKAYIEGQNDDDVLNNLEKIVSSYITLYEGQVGVEEAVGAATKNSNISKEVIDALYKRFGVTPPTGAQKTPTGGAQSLDDIPSSSPAT